MNITKRQLRRFIKQAINEHQVKPSVTNISPDYLAKINSLIDGGSIAQARVLIDALGGPDDYVDNYIEYGEVGDLEKLGNETASMFDDPLPSDIALPPRPLKPGFSYDDVHAKDQEASALARDKREANRDSYPPGFDAEDAYDMHIERYFGNRNRPVRDDDFLKEAIAQRVLLREMAVRRIMEIEMSEQYYLKPQDSPGTRIGAGTSVESLMDGLYDALNNGYTHVVVDIDMRDFRNDRSQFRYGIFQTIERAIVALKVRRDPRVLFARRGP